MEVNRFLKADCESDAIIATHPKGDYFVTTCAKGIVKLWHVETGSGVQLRGHTRRAINVVFSPLGEMLCTCSMDHTVRLWNTESGDCLMTLEGHEDKVLCAEFDARGRNICSIAADGQVRVWRVMDGRCTKKIDGKLESPVTCCAMSTTGTQQKSVVVCGCADGTIVIIDLERKARMLTLKGHEKEIKQLRFHPLKKELLCSSSEDGTLRLWNVAQGECTQVVDGEFGEVSCFTFIPGTGHLLLACCQHSAPSAKETAMQKITRSTLMFLASGAGSAKLQGAGWGESYSKLVLVGFDGQAFSEMMAAVTLHSAKNERVSSACFTEGASQICSVTGRKVHLWEIKYKAIVPSMRAAGEGEIAINIFEPEREAGRPSELMEEIEPEANGALNTPPKNGFLRASAHDMDSYPPNYSAQRDTREEAVEQRLLESTANRMERPPRPPAARAEAEIQEEEEDELNPRVTASVGWSLKPVEPASNTSLALGGFGGVVAVPIKDEDPGAGAGVGAPPRVKHWRGKGGPSVDSHYGDVSPDYS